MKKIAFIGIGKHALEHLIPSLLVTPNMSFYAAYSSSKKKLAKIKNMFGVNFLYTSIDKLLDNPEIEIVAISGSPDFHYSIALLAIEKGKHVFIEKPPAEKKEELLKLLSCAKKNRASVVVGYNFTRGRKILEAKNKIGSRLIQNMEIEYTSKRPRSIQYHYGDLLENGLHVLAIHPFHTLIDSFGEIEKMSTLYSSFLDDLFKVDHFFKFKSGQTASLSWGNYSNKFIFDIKLTNREGDFLKILSMHDVLSSTSRLKRLPNYDFEPFPVSGSGYSFSGYQESWELLRDSVRSKDVYLKDLKDSIYIFDLFSVITKDFGLSDNSRLAEHNVGNIRLME